MKVIVELLIFVVTIVLLLALIGLIVTIHAIDVALIREGAIIVFSALPG